MAWVSRERLRKESRQERLVSKLGTGREEGEGRVKGKTGLGLNPSKSPQILLPDTSISGSPRTQGRVGPGCGDTG